MNNGFNGTGTAFIFYVLLALCMPLVFIYRVIRHRPSTAYKFVVQHFVTGLLVAAIALSLIGLVWRKVEFTAHGHMHTVLLATAWMAIGTLVTWILIPRFVRTSYRLTGKRNQIHPINPNIQPWIDEWYAQLPQLTTAKKVPPRRVTTSRPFRHYGLFPTTGMRGSVPITIYLPVQRRLPR